jgi:hypothetical protein
MRITARFEEGSVESLVGIGAHSHDELADRIGSRVGMVRFKPRVRCSD